MAGANVQGEDPIDKEVREMLNELIEGNPLLKIRAMLDLDPEAGLPSQGFVVNDSRRAGQAIERIIDDTELDLTSEQKASLRALADQGYKPEE